MNKKHEQTFGLLFAVSSLIALVARLMPSNGSNLLDFIQGLLTGIGIAGMIASLIIFGRHSKRAH